MSVDYVLHESSVGYAVFKVTMQPDTIGARLKEVQQKANDLASFGKMVQLASFAPFQNSQQALENANDISEGIVSDYLQSVLEANLPRASDKNKVTIAVSDRSLAGGIREAFPGISCETPETSEIAGDLLRGVRLHSQKLLKQLQEGDVERAQLGLGHSYSRSKVKFNVNRNDNHIIQAIATLDNLDKNVNTFAMRVREWYSWHFPELVRIVSDNHTYAKLVLFIGNKKTLSENSLHDLAALVNDDKAIATNIVEAAKTSMGQDITEDDMNHVLSFARCAVGLANYRKSLYAYLVTKMGVVAPNLTTLLGETISARLIQKAGSLTTLAKYPASTVQILGAEKALFRALKTKGNTPKYGLIYHSSFIGRAGQRNKGRISRFLANKCSIASRIDNFSETPSTTFGQALRSQVEERLNFYASGATPRKNRDVMAEAMNSVLDSIAVNDGAEAIKGKKKSKTKPIVPPVDEAMEDIIPGGEAANRLAEGEDEKARKLAKKEKKLLKAEKKKRKHGDVDPDLQAPDGLPQPTGTKIILDDVSAVDKEQKKKKKKHKHKHDKE